MDESEEGGAASGSTARQRSRRCALSTLDSNLRKCCDALKTVSKVSELSTRTRTTTGRQLEVDDGVPGAAAAVVARALPSVLMLVSPQ